MYDGRHFVGLVDSLGQSGAGLPFKEVERQAQDMAELITFLASARANYITGAVIDIDGGYLTT